MRLLHRVVAVWSFLACGAHPAAAEGRFTFAPWRTVSPASGWSFASGDFSADGLSDLLGYYGGNGSVWVLTNTGTTFTAVQWATVSPVSDWQFKTGEFSGDGVLDIIGYHPSNGSVWVGTNLGSGFSFVQWATLSPASGWQIVAGDFAGDGRSDVMAYDTSSGQLRVGANTGAGFTFSTWATVSPASGWHFDSGHFASSTGSLDVVGYQPSNGTVWVGDNIGAGFTFATWANALDPGYVFSQIAAGEFTGDDRTDMVGYDASNGSLVVASNVGTKFLLRDEHAWAHVSPVSGWSFAAGAFTGPAEHDLVGYSGGLLSVGDNIQPLQGYAWPFSAAPGGAVDFMLSGRGSSTATLLRHKANGAGVTSIPMGTASFTPTPRQEPDFAYRDGCAWPTSLTLTIPSNWPSGMYSARLTDRDGTESHVPFVVKPAPALRSKVAVIANVNTWLAYNNWGGKSHYDGAADLSFLRPNPAASPVAELRPEWAGTHPYNMARGELWTLGWLEDDGHHPDVYSDIDFHNGLPGGYDTLVLSNHPEYWSTQMYDQLQTFLAGGGSLLYLGGNGIYEAGEYLPGETRFRLTSGAEDADRTPYTFRRLVPPRPERALLGVATERCGVVGLPYRTLEPAHPIMQCAGLSLNEVIGSAGLHQALYGSTLTNGAAAGLETDTSSGAGATGQPFDCGASTLVVPPSTLPGGLEVLAAAIDGSGQRFAELTYYEHPGGGLVLSAGSITFGGSLAVDPDLQSIVQCALAEVVSRQPICDNGQDDDGDGFTDSPSDPGCLDGTSVRENPKCQDGLDNDGDGKFDFDGGASVNAGTPLGPIDPQCNAAPYRNREAPSGCGVGGELAFAIPALLWLRRRPSCVPPRAQLTRRV